MQTPKTGASLVVSKTYYDEGSVYLNPSKLNQEKYLNWKLVQYGYVKENAREYFQYKEQIKRILHHPELYSREEVDLILLKTAVPQIPKILLEITLPKYEEVEQRLLERTKKELFPTVDKDLLLLEITSQMLTVVQPYGPEDKLHIANLVNSYPIELEQVKQIFLNGIFTDDEQVIFKCLSYIHKERLNKRQDKNKLNNNNLPAEGGRLKRLRPLFDDQELEDPGELQLEDLPTALLTPL